MAACPPLAPRTVALRDALGCVLGRRRRVARGRCRRSTTPPSTATPCGPPTPRERPVELEAIGVLAAGFAADRAVEPGAGPAHHDRCAAARRGRRRGHGGGHRGDRRPGPDRQDGGGRRRRAPRRRRRASRRGRAGRPAPCSGPPTSACSRASASWTWPVVPKARVGVLSTGDELVEGGAPLATGPDPGVEPADAAGPRRRGRRGGRRPRPGPRRRGRAGRGHRAGAPPSATPS